MEEVSQAKQAKPIEPIQPIQLKKRKRLTLKQEGFVKDYLETKNLAEAVSRNYNVKDRTTASVIGIENLSKPNIQQALEELKAIMVTDSYEQYAIQKSIQKTAISGNNLELANKIANKILDRAGLVPIAKSESRRLTAKFNFKRG